LDPKSAENLRRIKTLGGFVFITAVWISGKKPTKQLADHPQPA
jgi:hypothetical protein